MPKLKMKSIGLVIPCYNEQDTINKYYRTTEQVFSNMKHKGYNYIYKYMFIDDGSTDNTLLILRKLHQQNPKHVHYISFSRNFGIEADMLAGFKALNTDYTAKMDADLQDPPQLIPKMMNYLKKGYDCVGCIQQGRHQSKLRSYLSNMFYKIINKISTIHIQVNVRDFRMMNRQFLKSYLQFTERNRFSKGLFAWLGYKVKFIKFKSQPRSAGQSDWSINNLIQYALEAIIDFSDIPLRLPTYIGIFSTILSITGYIIAILISSSTWLIISTIILMNGLILLNMGILGKYLGKTYLETKHRPLYIIRERK